MRHPAFFRVEEGYANRHYMTGLVRDVRARMRAVSADRGRRLLLGVRVPPGIADCNRVGLDVVRWLEEGLVDIVVVGGGFISFETPVDEFVAAAAGTGALVYGCIEATRDSDDRKLRALAFRWLEDGAHGVYLYNFFTRSPGWNRRIASELTDPEKLRRLDKRYELETTGSAYGSSGHSSAFALAQSQTQLPVRLQPNDPGEGPVLRLAIADDLEEAREAGELGPLPADPAVRRPGGERLPPRPPQRERAGLERGGGLLRRLEGADRGVLVLAELPRRAGGAAHGRVERLVRGHGPAAATGRERDRDPPALGDPRL